jgi:hypothetical protein
MSGTTKHSASKDRCKEFARLLKELEVGADPELVNAFRSVLTAMEYGDSVLIRSHLNVAFEYMKKKVESDIQSVLSNSLRAKTVLKDFLADIEGEPYEDWDGMGESIRSMLDNLTQSMSELQDAANMLRARGHETEGAEQLEAESKELLSLKRGILDNWPWSTRALPPADRRMVAESRKAFAGGGFQSVDELVRQLGGDTEKAEE